MSKFVIIFSIFTCFYGVIRGQETPATPTHYELFLNLAESRRTSEFTGYVKIDFDNLVQSSKLVVDCENLTVLTETANVTEITGVGGGLLVQDILVQNGVCEITLNGNLEVNKKYTLELDFVGKVNSEPIGVFEEYYTEDFESVTHLITTNFKGGNAHLAFPCFDSPNHKATFSVKLGHTNEYDMVGSTPISLKENIENYIVTSFQKTPQPINANLIGFAFYQNLTKTSLTPIDIFHSQVNKNASRLVVATLSEMRLTHGIFFGASAVTNHYFMAAPFKTMQGRIDHWGFSIVDESDFLRSVITSTPQLYQKTLQMYSHQFCLNWVEYEVTPHTWSEWWVSRGLAKFYEYYIPANSLIYQVWIHWKQFVTEVTHNSMEKEEVALIGTENDVTKSLQFNERAGAIFNMIQGVMGINNFNEGIKSFVKLFSGTTVKSTDLFDELSKHVVEPLPADLRVLFGNWFENKGFPLVRVTRRGSNISLKQEPYTPSHTPDVLRYIPINFATDADFDFEDTSIYEWLLPDPNSEITIENIPEDGLIILNKQQTSYYRVLYDDQTYDLLTEFLHLNHTEIHPVNRAQLIDDLGSFTRHGYVEYSLFCSFLEYLANEDHYIVWRVANKHINFLFHKLRSSEAFGRFETFIREITETHFDELGLGTDIGLLSKFLHHKRLNRQYVADLACFAGVDSCVNETMEYVEQLMERNVSIVLPEMIPIMACTAFKHDYGILDRLLEFLKTPANKSVERRSTDLMASVNLQGAVLDLIIESIGCSRNESSLQSTLDLSIIPSKTISITISRSTRRKLFESVVKGSHVGTEMGLKFLKEQYLAMNQRYDNMAYVFEAFNGYLLTDELLEMYTEIVRTYEAKFYPETVRVSAYNTLDASKNDVEWTNKYLGAIEDWLADNQYNGTTTEAPGSGTSLRINIGVILIVFIFITSFTYH